MNDFVPCEPYMSGPPQPYNLLVNCTNYETPSASTISVASFLLSPNILQRTVPKEEPGWLSGIASDYGLDDRRFKSQQGLGIFLFTTAVSRPALGPTQHKAAGA
jgi:hypothetical protein